MLHKGKLAAIFGFRIGLILSKRKLDSTFACQLHTTKIGWYDTRHDFPNNLSHPTVFIKLVASCVTG